MNKNWIIVSFEGIDYTGKTSLCNMLKSSMQGICSKEVIFLSDPPLIEPWAHLKDFFERSNEIDKLSEAIMLLSARIDLFNRIIKPKLSRYSIIILDRFIDSWFAYQSIRLRHYFQSQELALDFLCSLEQIIEKNKILYPPDKTILFLVDEHTLKNRMKTRKIKSKYEHLNFLMEVQKQYIALAERYKERYIIVDTQSKNLQEVYEDVQEIISRIANNKR